MPLVGGLSVATFHAAWNRNPADTFHPGRPNVAVRASTSVNTSSRDSTARGDSSCSSRGSPLITIPACQNSPRTTAGPLCEARTGRGRDHPVRPSGGSPFSARGGSVLVGADEDGVDLAQPVDVSSCIRPGPHLLQGSGEDAVEGVAAEAGVDRLPWPVAFRQVTPGDPGPDLVDHAVDHPTVFHPRTPCRGSRYERSE